MSSEELDEDSGRLYTPCPTVTSRFTEEELVATCDECGRFCARCCTHMEEICHHARIVYTDGACTNNGKYGAVAGIGIAFGIHQGDSEDEDLHQFSISIDEKLDPGGRRTSQRAELIAALEGLKKICRHDEEWFVDVRERLEDGGEDPPPIVIVTTDSEYVVKGMTEWLPSWKKNGMRKSNGQRPSNLDLFRKLDAEVEKRERRHGFKVTFWHINRTHNALADHLAKRGARAAIRGVNKDLGDVVHAISAWQLTD